MQIILSILSIYFFILLGYVAKKKLKDEIQEKSLVVISIYFLQPILAFWGLSSRKIDAELLQAPLIYALISLTCIAVSFFLARVFFTEQKDRSIVTIAATIGNTGNIGIPIGIALLGEASIIYTSMMNVANVFIVYTIGVFFYSRGNFSIKESFINIFKIPLIWFALIALTLNLLNVEINHIFDKSLEMGAYAAMVLQLMIFGMYLFQVKLKSINYKLLLHVSFIKFIIIPIIGLCILSYLSLETFVVSVILLELVVPLAVTNVNLSALYDCKPVDVTALVFFTSLLFVPFIILIMQIMSKLS